MVSDEGAEIWGGFGNKINLENKKSWPWLFKSGTSLVLFHLNGNINYWCGENKRLTGEE